MLPRGVSPIDSLIARTPDMREASHVGSVAAPRPGAWRRAGRALRASDWWYFSLLPLVSLVGDLSGDMHQKLMRLVERDQIDRRDLRIIGATGQNILERVESRAFDVSLFYRLNVIHIVIP